MKIIVFVLIGHCSVLVGPFEASQLCAVKHICHHSDSLSHPEYGVTAVAALSGLSDSFAYTWFLFVWSLFMRNRCKGRVMQQPRSVIKLSSLCVKSCDCNSDHTFAFRDQDWLKTASDLQEMVSNAGKNS